MSWKFIMGATEVILPRNPEAVECTEAADIKSFSYPKQLALLISLGKKERVLVLEGILHVVGKTRADLYTDYISKLSTMVYKKVAIEAPDSVYDGDWILASLKYPEIKGTPTAYRFRLEFWQGFKMVVLE